MVQDGESRHAQTEPPKELLTIRVDRYQTRMNAVLRAFMEAHQSKD